MRSKNYALKGEKTKDKIKIGKVHDEGGRKRLK